MPEPSRAPLVLIVDDEPTFRGAVSSLLRSVGYRVDHFATTQELVESRMAGEANCLILDVRLPMVSGLDFQARLAEAGAHPPIIFVTGHGDIPMTVRAMKAGAVDFLSKPFRDQDLLDAAAAAVVRDGERRRADESKGRIRSCYASLSPREREIMTLATAGLMNKQIAGDLGLSEITVKIHRGRLMKKMGARTFADLVKMAEVLDLGGAAGTDKTRAPSSPA